MATQNPAISMEHDEDWQDGNGFEAITRAGIARAEDALLTIPSGYVDASSVHASLQDVLKSLANKEPLVIADVKITGVRGFYKDTKKLIPPGKKLFTKETSRLEIFCIDKEQQTFSISVFGAIWGWKEMLEDGMGKVHTITVKSARQFGKDLYLDAEPCEGRLLANLGKVIPLYAGIPGAVKSERLADCVDRAVALAQEDRRYWFAARDQVLREAYCSEKELLEVANTSANSLAVILRALHRPQSYEEAQLAREAIVQVAAAATRTRSQHFFGNRKSDPACAISGIRASVANVIAELKEANNIQLTGDQQTAVNALATAMEQPYPSAHLLNGDVGTGKTLTFLIPAVAAFRRGKNIAIMAPTGILADQLARELVDKFPSATVARIEAGGKIPKDRAILVGTPGLTSVCAKAKWVPDVLITDEQHKMTAADREALVGRHTHVIEATATPIPRTMAIAMYAGMKQLVLAECPVQKTLLTKAIFGAEGRQELATTASRVLKEGKKVAFIYPAVQSEKNPGEEDKQASKASVMDAYNRMNAKWPGKVAKLYGDMSDEEKRAEIAALKSGEKNVLVASSLVEVGIDIPSLDGMVVSDADHFGLASLHQLRGRLARKGGIGYFMLYVNKAVKPLDYVEPPANDESPRPKFADKKTVERMRALEQTSNGFELAEIDLAQRGFGDTGGEQQSGRGYTIFRGLNIPPIAFLKLSIKNEDGSIEELPPLPTPGEPEEVIETTGQLSLI